MFSQTKIKYDESFDFIKASQSLNNLLKLTTNSSKDRTKDFIIAHSQGGLVSRVINIELDKGNFTSRYFGGIVTFGTPHLGAEILRDRVSKISNLTTEATKLAYGPEATVAHLLFPGSEVILNWFGLEKKLQDFTTKEVTKYVVSAAIDKIPKLGDYYIPNTTYLNNLNLYQPKKKIPSVAFYGVEEENNICFKTLYNFTFGDANKQGEFNAEITDNTANKTKQTMFDIYKGLKDYYITKNWVSSVLTDARKTADAYQSGIDFLNSADDLWLNIIGALSYTYDSKRIVMCDCPNVTMNLSTKPREKSMNNAVDYSTFDLKYKYYVPDDVNSNVQAFNGDVITRPDGSVVSTDVFLCPNINCNPRWVTQYIPIRNVKESDGIVLVESAKGFPNVDITVKLPSSNHNQMKNDINTKKALNDLFNGVYGQYFMTTKR